MPILSFRLVSTVPAIYLTVDSALSINPRGFFSLKLISTFLIQVCKTNVAHGSDESHEVIMTSEYF